MCVPLWRAKLRGIKLKHLNYKIDPLFNGNWEQDGLIFRLQEPTVVHSLSVTRDLDGQELNAHDQNAVLLRRIPVHILPNQGEEVVVVQLVEFVDKGPPQFLALRRLHLVLIQLPHVHLGKVLAEGTVDLVIEWRKSEFTGVGTAEKLRGRK